jgi:hypothetical protein
LTGFQVEEPSRSLTVTEAIRRLVLTDESGLITAAEVSRRLEQLGYGVPSRSLATILSRLAKDGKISHLVGPSRTALYGPTTKADPAVAQSYGKRAAVIARMRQSRTKSRKESN